MDLKDKRLTDFISEIRKDLGYIRMKGHYDDWMSLARDAWKSSDSVEDARDIFWTAIADRSSTNALHSRNRHSALRSKRYDFNHWDFSKGRPMPREMKDEPKISRFASPLPSRDEVADLKRRFPKGARVVLEETMKDDPHPIEGGEKGVVEYVDDGGTVHVRWDNGRSLGACPPLDKLEVVMESRRRPLKSSEDFDERERWAADVIRIVKRLGGSDADIDDKNLLFDCLVAAGDFVKGANEYLIATGKR